MAVKYKMDEDARDQLDRRTRIGIEACELADAGEERETQARNIVSDILTALFGPAGYCEWIEASDSESSYRGARVVLDEERGGLARTFLDMALESWEGDAEDYTATLVTVDNPLLPKDEPVLPGDPTQPRWFRLTLEISEDDLRAGFNEQDDPIGIVRDYGGVVGELEVKYEG